MMPSCLACTWPQGCAQTALGDELCCYHGKVRDGFITSTRTGVGTTGEAVAPITLTPADAAKARDAQDRYVDDVLVDDVLKPLWRRRSSA